MQCSRSVTEIFGEDDYVELRVRTTNVSSRNDNLTHRTALDKLIGKDRVVESRREKFIAISRLTDDYLDKTGHLTSFEGELEEGTDLIALVGQATSAHESMPFGWSMDGDNNSTEIGSTYTPQIHSPLSTG